MWKKYFKGLSVLNVVGLAIGIATAALIFLWIEDELSFDSSFAKKNLLYQVRTNQTYEGKTRTFNSTPGPLARAIVTEIPGIKSACRLRSGSMPLFTQADKSINENGFYADSTVFDLFTLQFIQGNPKTAFHNTNSVVISQKMAAQFFGNEKQVVGKILRFNNQEDFMISGVIEDLPANSTLQFDWLAPFANFEKKADWLKYWGANGVSTYIELKENADLSLIEKQLDNFIVKKSQSADAAHPVLIAMNDWHLRDRFEDGKHLAGGRITYVRLFGVIAWIVMIIACINFMNLSTARSEKRAREVSVRKILGAGRNRLVLQFIGEALWMSALAVMIALAIVAWALPLFNTLVEKKLTIGLDNPAHIFSLLAIGLLCGLLAGAWPAWYLSAFHPVKAMKNTGGSFRKVLVVAQFTISISLIIATIITSQQVKHVMNRELGYDKNNLLRVNLQGDMRKHFAVIKQNLINSGLAENAALSSNEVIYTSDNTTTYSWQGKDPASDILISYRMVSPEFLSTWGMEVIEGRNFREGDSTGVVISRSFEKLMGKESAVGKIIINGDKKYEVVGVIKDLVYGDMYANGDPVIFICSPAETEYLYIKVKPGMHPDQIASVLKPFPFLYQFVDDQFQQMFMTENMVGKLSRLFAALAIFISCLGLFGLAAYTAETRTREIGIRKVLGASVAGITALLTKDFLQLVAVAALVAFPLAWYTLSEWLNNYAYRIQIQPWVFVAAGAAAVLISLLTISVQAIRAAVANPVKSLRTE